MSVNIKTTMKTDKKRILVVDDQASDTRLMKLYLERTNDYVVREENNARAANAAAEEFQPHLILLDVMMPDMDGLSVIKSLRENSSTASIPIIFMTARMQSQDVLDYDQLGAIGFIAKPFDPMQLSATVKKIWEEKG